MPTSVDSISTLPINSRLHAISEGIFVMNGIMLSFVIWESTSLNFYLVLDFVNVCHTLKRHKVKRSLLSLSVKFTLWIWSIAVWKMTLANWTCPELHLFFILFFFLPLPLRRRINLEHNLSHCECLKRCACVCVVINVCLSHWGDLEVLKNRPLSFTEAFAVSFAHIPQLNMSSTETHYDTAVPVGMN